MTERERLVELIDKALDKHTSNIGNYVHPVQEWIADYLLENGERALPCKVGDTVYQRDNTGRIYESKIKSIIYDTDGIAFDERAIGETIFLTKEEAEKALIKRCGGDE